MEGVEEKAAGEAHEKKKAKAVYARTQVELAGLLGVSRRTLCSWRRLEGAPRALSNGMWPVAEWRGFVRERGLKESGVFSEGEDLRSRKLLAEVEERELKVAIRRQEYIRVAEVRAEWTRYVARAATILRTRFENELPLILGGLDAASIQAECRKAVDEVLRVLRDA